jgi:hypothetical protein
MIKKVRILVDEDVKKKYFIRVPNLITFAILVYLNDPEGWVSKGYTFVDVSENEDILIRLVSPRSIVKNCGIPDNLSCAVMNGHNIYLNADRWFHGSHRSKLGIEDYRQYMVTHEVGHILGHDHEKCPCKGCKAPVMMQQTKGIGKCVPNIKLVNKYK